MKTFILSVALAFIALAAAFTWLPLSQAAWPDEAEKQSDLGKLLLYTWQHNLNVSGGIKNDFGQILNDLIVCGIPGGGEQPNDPAASCHNVPGPPQS